MRFSDLSGHDTIKKSLIHAIAQDRIGNAYIFEGASGVGKSLCAKIFAQGLVCQGSDVPCGECDTCRQAETGVLPDIIYLKKAKNESSFSIDDVREQIIGEAYIKPRVARRKVFVIDSADDLNVASQNALLKVLEEPPSYVTFIICVTAKEKLLPTVLSRSQVVTFFPLPEETVKEQLLTLGASNDTAGVFARLSQGSPGMAQELLKNPEKCEKIKKTIDAFMSLSKGAIKVRETVEFLTEEKENISEIIRYILTFLRDCVMVKTGLCDSVVFVDRLSDIRVFTANISKKRLISAFDKLCDLTVKLNQNLNFNATVSETVVRIWEDFHDEGSGHQIQARR